jgi:hypothetical protein
MSDYNEMEGECEARYPLYDPDDDGNSWQSMYRLMRCPLPRN